MTIASSNADRQYDEAPMQWPATPAGKEKEFFLKDVHLKKPLRFPWEKSGA